MANISGKIFDELKKRLLNGVYPADSKFPAESQLADPARVECHGEPPFSRVGCVHHISVDALALGYGIWP